MADAEGYLVASDTDLPGVTVKPRVGFAHTLGGPFEFWAPLDRLPSTAELSARGFRKGEPVHMQLQGEASKEEFHAALAAKGFSATFDCEIPPLGGSAYIEAVFDLSRPQFRAVTKIAFNYLAAIAGPDVALLSCFDDARRFVRYNEGVRPVEVPMRRQADARRCHYVSVQTVANRVIAHVSLFMRIRYYEVTLAADSFDAALQSAHFFDLDARRLVLTLPLPVDASEGA